ncbi:MAG: hypothetical protein IKG66_04845, partial [Lachnospiraceae bacterium]|nr:hypothetical protein [Lachnospiraceae bacterium]
TVTVTGKGNFRAKVSRAFDITAKDLAEASILVGDVVYQNKAGIVKIKPSITDSNGKKLEIGTDYRSALVYTYVYDTRVKTGSDQTVLRSAGSAVESTDIIPLDTLLMVTASGKGNYTGEISACFRIVRASISGATAEIGTQYYHGGSVELEPDDITLKVGKKVLTADDFRIVGYVNNTGKGTAKVILKGTGDYGGILTASFTIAAKPIKTD